MALTVGSSQLTKRDVKMLDLVMSGEAAQLCGFLAGRTFLKWAKRYNVNPVGFSNGKAVYRREDVMRLAKLVKAGKSKDEQK